MNRHAENLGALSEHLAASQQRFAIRNDRHEPFLQIDQEQPTGLPSKQLRAAMGCRSIHDRMLRAIADIGNRGNGLMESRVTVPLTLWKVAVIQSTIRERISVTTVRRTS